MSSPPPPAQPIITIRFPSEGKKPHTRTHRNHRSRLILRVNSFHLKERWVKHVVAHVSAVCDCLPLFQEHLDAYLLRSCTHCTQVHSRMFPWEDARRSLPLFVIYEPSLSRGNYLSIGDVKEFFREINTRLSLCSVTPVALFCKSCCLCMKVQVMKVPRCQCESSFVKVLLVLEKMDSVFKCLWSMQR